MFKRYILPRCLYSAEYTFFKTILIRGTDVMGIDENITLTFKVRVKYGVEMELISLEILPRPN